MDRSEIRDSEAIPDVKNADSERPNKISKVQRSDPSDAVPAASAAPEKPYRPLVLNPNAPAIGAANPYTPTSFTTAIMERFGLLTFFSRNYPQAFGGYVRGKLKNGDVLPASGEGVLKLFRARDRGYGTLDLLSLIKDAAHEIHRDLPATENVQVGDISARAGGRVGGHGSHQNGLDADIVFFKKNHRAMDPTVSKPNVTGFDESFVDGKGRMTANFDVEANWRFIQLIVSTGRIDRIFVDEKIKKSFCEFAIAKGMRPEWTETLRKLRHWRNHRDHMHVRMSCPAKSDQCLTSAPIPTGDGCGMLLDSDKVGAFVSLGGESQMESAALNLHRDVIDRDDHARAPAPADAPEDGC
ncbi:MAG: penicillin-insensitive murein endopeptidase [Cryobacterium sp.]|nr:penicillin-insensitive murein endopeptidase [Oligoflexia bacterium]